MRRCSGFFGTGVHQVAQSEVILFDEFNTVPGLIINERLALRLEFVSVPHPPVVNPQAVEKEGKALTSLAFDTLDESNQNEILNAGSHVEKHSRFRPLSVVFAKQLLAKITMQRARNPTQ